MMSIDENVINPPEGKLLCYSSAAAVEKTQDKIQYKLKVVLRNTKIDAKVNAKVRANRTNRTNRPNCINPKAASCQLPVLHSTTMTNKEHPADLAGGCGSR